ncbi:MAG: hypothetical protein ACJ8AW_43870, partial [Rhodopila sp.]
MQTRDRILAMSSKEFERAKEDFFAAEAREEMERDAARQMEQFTGPPPPPGSVLGVSQKEYERARREFDGREYREHRETLRAEGKRNLDAL